MRKLTFTLPLIAHPALAADPAHVNRPYVLDGEERQMATTFAAAQVAGNVCRVTDGAYINRAFFSNWSAQYAERAAGRERALKAAIAQARSGVMAQVNAAGADDWCYSYLDSIADTAAPNNTPIYWDDALGQFNGPPSRSAVEVWDFFNAD